MAIDGENYPDKRKVALLVSISSKTGWDIFNSLPLSAANKKKYDAVVKAFGEHCSPRKNETYERYVPRTRLQSDGEKFDSFLTDLRLKAQSCN